MARDTGLTMH